jgi:hypothetical protein
MTADLGGGPDDADLVLFADGGQLGWAPARHSRFGPRLVERTRLVEPVGAGAPLGAATAMAASLAGPAGPAGPAGAAAHRRPAVPVSASRPTGGSGPGRISVPVTVPRRLPRHRRSLAVSLAGLAFGVIASAAGTAAPSTAAPATGTVSPGQVPAQLATVVSRSPLQASTFSFSRSSRATELVADRATRPR